MMTTRYKTKLISMSVNALLIILISTSSYASYKQWPLIKKGEVRYMKMIKVYDISLFSPSKVNANNILSPTISKCLKLDYGVNLSVDKFRLATTKILNRQHSADYLKSINTPLETLQKAYQPVKKGDTYTLCYNGSNQFLSLALNDKKLVDIKSAELAKAYLGIWLSKNQPISMPLYKAFFGT